MGSSSVPRPKAIPDIDLKPAISALKTVTAVATEQMRGTSLGYVPCRFFLRGFCRNGEACKFQHGTLEKLEDGQLRHTTAPDYPDLSVSQETSIYRKVKLIHIGPKEGRERLNLAAYLQGYAWISGQLSSWG